MTPHTTNPPMDKATNQVETAVRNVEDAHKPPMLSVVIPAYNEGGAIGETLDSLLHLATEHHWEIIVVNDGSTDDTATQVRSRMDGHRIQLLNHPYNRGYGAALKTGIRRSEAGLIATMDSDGQHDPLDLLSLLPLAADFELVVGRRPGFFHSKLWRMPGKWVLNRLANYLTGRKIPDLNSGMRLFHAEVVKKYLHLFPDGFSFSTTSTLLFYNRGYAVTFTPITIRGREPSSISTVTLGTGFETLILIMRLASLFHPLRVFIPASLSFVSAGFLWGLPYILLAQGISVGALLLLVTGLLLFFFGLLVDQVAQLRLEKYE